jgi:hypothetical protein
MEPVEPTPYYIRTALHSLFGWVVALIFFIVFIYNRQPNIAIGLSLFWFCLWTIRSAIRTKYNLLKYEVNGEQILLTYQKFNSIRTASIDQNDLELKWTGLFERSPNMYKLKFYAKDQQIIYQTTTGDWPFDKLRTFIQDLYSNIDKEPSLDTRMTLDWWGKEVR